MERQAPHPTEDTCYLINLAARRFSTALQRRLGVHGIGIGQWSALRFLWQEDGIMQIELARRVGIQGSTTVSTLDRMEQTGLIERIPDRDNRRQTHVFLTQRGRDLRPALEQVSTEVNGLAMQGTHPAGAAQRVAAGAYRKPSVDRANIARCLIGPSLSV